MNSCKDQFRRTERSNMLSCNTFYCAIPVVRKTPLLLRLQQEGGSDYGDNQLINNVTSSGGMKKRRKLMHFITGP